MQSDTPQGDPRLQRTSPAPKIAVGHLDPCIISMETTLPGEIPMLVHVWAASCREVRAPGEQHRWELTDAVILKSFYRKPHLLHAPEWGFKIQSAKSVALACPGAARSTQFSDFSSMFDYAPAHVYQWNIRYLDHVTDEALRRVLSGYPDQPDRLAPILLTYSGVDWPSVTQAVAAAMTSSTATDRRRRTSRPSLVRRLLSSVFKKKKSKLVHA